MTEALIMAGGRSERMRASRGPDHKAMVRVLGAPMIERNLLALLAHGFRDLAIAVNAREPSLEEYIRSRGREIVEAVGGTLELVRETQPLGTIGIAQEFADHLGSHARQRVGDAPNGSHARQRVGGAPSGSHARQSVGNSQAQVEDLQPQGAHGLATVATRIGTPNSSAALLIVNVDNLSSLDLRGLMSHHRETGALFTVATHEEPFLLPFGQVIVRDGRLVEYREKPTLPLVVSSGTYVLSPAACRLISPQERTDAPQLIQRIMDQGDLVASFAHQAAWIDVNDAHSVQRAERLIARDPSGFECWDLEGPVREYVHVAYSDDESLWVQAEDGLLPCVEFSPETVPSGVAEFPRIRAGSPTRPEFLGIRLHNGELQGSPDWSIDSIDIERGQWRRDHLLRTREGPHETRRLQRLRWDELNQFDTRNHFATPGNRLLSVMRSLSEADQNPLRGQQAVLRRA